MTLDALIMFLGAFVAVLPFLGFPNSWDKIMLLVAGVLIVVLGIALRRKLSVRGPRARASLAQNTVRTDEEHGRTG